MATTTQILLTARTGRMSRSTLLGKGREATHLAVMGLALWAFWAWAESKSFGPDDYAPATPACQALFTAAMRGGRAATPVEHITVADARLIGPMNSAGGLQVDRP